MHPENLPQDLEKIESAPGVATDPEMSGGADAAREQGCAFARPKPRQIFDALHAAPNDRPQNLPQGPEKIESAPRDGWPAEASASGAAPVVSSAVPSPIDGGRPNLRAMPNGVAPAESASGGGRRAATPLVGVGCAILCAIIGRTIARTEPSCLRPRHSVDSPRGCPFYGRRGRIRIAFP
jgi:hypothetical protein